MIGETDSRFNFIHQSIDYSYLYGLKMAKKLAETFLHINVDTVRFYILMYIL